MCWKSNSLSSSDDDDARHFDDSVTAIDDSIRDHMNDIKLKSSPFQQSMPNNNRPATARTQLLERQYFMKQSKKSKVRTMPQTMSQTQNLSNALRREVITFITAGLVTGVKVTAWETNKWCTDPKSTWDDDFDADAVDNRSFTYHGNTVFRDDTETHPALQFFPTHKSSIIDGDNIRTKRYAKSNSFAGFILDNNGWNPNGKKVQFV